MITTARDMYIAFLHGVQLEDAEGVPAEKFNFWINKAQEDWLTERSKQVDLEQKRLDDLSLLKTERIIRTNGSRTVAADGTLRLFDTSSGGVDYGAGTFVVTPERYFSISGLEFYKSSTTSGTIDFVTGEVILL